MKSLKEKAQQILNSAGVKINGNKPWDIIVHNEKFYRKVMTGGSLALGESYMDGWWDCKQLDQFFYKVLKEKLDTKNKTWNTYFHVLISKLLNMQTKSRAKKVARGHYDLSTYLFEAFLDPYNQYTCGYFKDTDDLNTAQEQKLNLICKKLQLTPKDKVLDIGCGWGGFAKYAAEHYGCHVTGVTISDEQAKYAKKYCKGLPVTIIKSDYRDVKGSFTKVLICGMIEHVGYKNYRTLMEVVHRCLKDDGLYLLHTIGRDTSATSIDSWIGKYIFPNGMLPSIRQIAKAIEGIFVMEDLHNFGAYYDNTLMAWYKNFDKNWNKLKQYYDERFYRMWKYYLLSCAGASRSRRHQLWQIVLSKNGVPGGYKPIRY